MKYLLPSGLFFISVFSFGQNVYDITIQKLKSNNEYSDSVLCIGSTMLEKAEYYVYNNSGYVVVYIKNSENDYYGKPYLFCDISNQRWQSFRNGGVSSWGQSYHDYIKPFVCNSGSNSSYSKPEYKIQSAQESINVPLVADVLRNLNENNSRRNYRTLTVEQENNYFFNCFFLDNGIDKLEKYRGKLDEEYKKSSQKLSLNIENIKLYDLENYEDGWYEFLTSTGDFYNKRLFEIKNKQIINCFMRQSATINEIIKNNDNTYTLVAPFFKVKLNVYLDNQKKLKNPDYGIPVELSFSAKQKDIYDGILIYVFDINNPKKDISIHKIEKNELTSKNDCGDSETKSVVKFLLNKNKKYKYFAIMASKQNSYKPKFWEGDINIITKCNRIVLNND